MKHFMKRHMNIQDFYLIRSFSNRIRLICGNQLNTINDCLWSSSLIDLFNMPLNVALLDVESKVQVMNESNANVWKCSSPNETIGMSIRDIYRDTSANFSLLHDDLTLKQDRLIIKEENCIRMDDISFPSITAKLPYYNHENNLAGILAISLTLGLNIFPDIQQSFKSFSEILMKNERIFPDNNSKNIYLTTREKEILNLVVLGKTARESANILKLSKRTIEFYVENIKVKFNVSTKSELIEKAIII